MLDDINELRTFVSVVAARSLSAAARQMDLALSVVSKRLAALERRTGTRLVARSTRRLAPTEEGMDLYERAQRILAEIDQAEVALTSGQVEPQGLLRVSAPVAFGQPGLWRPRSRTPDAVNRPGSDGSTGRPDRRRNRCCRPDRAAAGFATRHAEADRRLPNSCRCTRIPPRAWHACDTRRIGGA